MGSTKKLCALLFAVGVFAVVGCGGEEKKPEPAKPSGTATSTAAPAKSGTPAPAKSSGGAGW